MVDGSLQPAAQRGEHHRDQPNGHERDDDVPADLHDRAQEPDKKDVDSDDAGGQCSVDQGAIDHQVDVEEMVAQHRDADRHRHEQHDEVEARV